MRILILSRNPALYSTSRLVRAARARGHRTRVVDPLELHIPVATGRRGLRHLGKPLGRFDVVIPRIGASVTRYGLAVLRQVEAGGGVVLNTARSIALSRDKVVSLQLLAKRRLPVPASVCVRSLQGVEDAVALVGGFPLVIKLQQGTQGVGVMLVESMSAAVGLLETFCSMGHEVILQQFVASGGRDVRAFVVGNKVVAAMRRIAPEGDFRANIHCGARAEPLTLPRRSQNMAVKAAKILGLDVTGVDILEHAGGNRIIELNSSPGLEGIEHVCSVDVATAIIAHAERRLAAQERAS